MAFCNACGATLEGGAKFCAKCGAGVPGAPAAVASTPPPAPTGTAPAPQGSSALKIILIIVAIIVGLGMIGLGTMGFIAWRVVKNTQVEERGGKVKVNTPFGKVESSEEDGKVKVDTVFGKMESSSDAKDVIDKLGVDVYPGAQVLKDGAAIVNFGGMHTASAEFETSDSPEEVAKFYASRLPHASHTSSSDHHTIYLSEKGHTLTIAVEPRNDKTHISISNISGKSQ